MLITTLYRVAPYVVYPSLWCCFIVLLVEPKNWRILMLSVGRSVKTCFIISGVSSPVFTCWGLFPRHISSILAECWVTCIHYLWLLQMCAKNRFRSTWEKTGPYNNICPIPFRTGEKISSREPYKHIADIKQIQPRLSGKMPNSQRYICSTWCTSILQHLCCIIFYFFCHYSWISLVS